jgi:RHS repeat-associated protein
LYDTSGNQKQDQAGRQFTYDAENHQVTFNTTAGTYSYDGDGRRVKKTDSSGTTVFVYNAGGQLIAEYTSVDPVSTNGLSYLTSDHLGSTRLVTDINGYVKARHDYLPFGEELPSNVGSRSSVDGYGAVDGVRQKFTQKERDNESGLDYFDARYYSSAQGRFTSPDEFVGGPQELFTFANAASSNPTFYADIRDPQSLNKYQYTYNNPLIYIDPDGHQTLKKKVNGFISGFSNAQAKVSDCSANAAIGVAKSVANLFIGIGNLTAGREQFVPYQEKGDCQGVAMDITNQAAVVLPLLGGAGPAGVLTAEAEETTVVVAEGANVSVTAKGAGAAAEGSGAGAAVREAKPPAAGIRGGRNQPKEMTPSGTVDNLKGLQHHQKATTKAGGYRISTKKAEQNIDTTNRKTYTSSKDIKKQK